MELSTELEIEYKLARVTWDKTVAKECLDYFKRFPENEEWFIHELNELYWRNKYIGSYRNHISLTAIPLANKIYEQLEIVTFPFIQRVACRGWDTAGGTWAWPMSTLHSDIGSSDPVKYLLKKTVKLEMLEGIAGHGEICGTDCPVGIY